MAFATPTPTLIGNFRFAGARRALCESPRRPRPYCPLPRVRMTDGPTPVDSSSEVDLLSTVGAVKWLPSPVTIAGKVQRGFGRGSRKLGTPTANLPGSLLDGVGTMGQDGVYIGFGVVPSLSSRPVKMVANIGRNITFDDVPERVLEAFLMDDTLQEEFYGEEMRLCVIGYMRAEVKFDGIAALVANIRNDVAVAKEALESPHALPFADHHFLMQ